MQPSATRVRLSAGPGALAVHAHTRGRAQAGARAAHWSVRAERGHTEAAANATEGHAAPNLTRRALVLGAVGAVLGARSATAEEATAKKLPKAYKEDCSKLVTTLIASVQLDRDGAKEAEVRRKADEAKDQVKVFVNKWRDDPRTRSETATREVGEALKVLGSFYLKYGQRTRLPSGIADEVLGHLELAETYLNGLNV